MGEEKQLSRFGILTETQNFRGVISYLDNFYKTLKNRDYNICRKLKSVYGYQLQDTFIKAIKSKMYALTLKQALINLLKQSSQNEKVIFKIFLYNSNFNEFLEHSRQAYRVLSKMWSKYLEIYRKLSTSIYQK